MLRGIVGRDVGAVVSGSPVPDCAAPLTKPLSKVGRGIERLALQELAQHRTALAPEDPARHPGVFLADLPFVLGKALGRRTQDGEIRIHQQLRVRRRRRDRVPRRHHQRHHALAHVGRKPRCRQSARCPLRALRPLSCAFNS